MPVPVLPRYDLVQFVQEITDNIRIGVLIYGNGGRGMRDKNGTESLADTGSCDRFPNPRGDID